MLLPPLAVLDDEGAAFAYALMRHLSKGRSVSSFLAVWDNNHRASVTCFFTYITSSTSVAVGLALGLLIGTYQGYNAAARGRWWS